MPVGKQRPPHLPERVFLVLELAYVPRGEASTLNVVASVPGRESTVVRSWPTPNGRLTAPQASDVTTVLANHGWDAIYAMLGTQQTLGV